MNDDVKINWKGRQINYNPSVFYEQCIPDDESSLMEIQEMYQSIQEVQTECQDFIQEGSLLKNIGKGFVTLIKKIISLFVRAFRFIGNLIGKLLGFNTKSLSSICKELVTPKDGKLKISDSYNKNDPLLKHTTVNGNEMSINVGGIFKKSKNSSKMPTTIKTVVNEVIYRVDQGFSIKIGESHKDDWPVWLTAGLNNANKQEQPAAGQIEIRYLLAYIDHPELITKIGSTFKPILDALTSGAKIDFDTFGRYDKSIRDLIKDLSNKLESHIKHNRNVEQYVSADSMRKLQKAVSSTSDLFIEFQDAKFDINTALHKAFERTLIESSQQILNTLENIQMGLNALVKATNHSGKFIPGSYIGSCGNLVLLDTFVQELIKEGIPSAYVGLNAYLIADPKIRGSYDADFEPKWGQSRLTLYPSDKSKLCYKVALNGMGKRSNNTEYSLYKSKPDLKDIIAGVHEIGSNKCVIVIDRLQENKDVQFWDVTKFVNDNQDLLDKHHIADVHANNVAYDANGKLKIIDFGWVNMNA